MHFLDDAEKLEYFSGSDDISGLNYRSTMKAFECAEYLLYTFKEDKTLHIITAFQVVDISMNGFGVAIKLIDKKTYKVWTIGDTPVFLNGLHIALHIPYRCTIERSVRVPDKGKPQRGLTTGIVALTQYHRESAHIGGVYIVPQNLAQKVIGARLIAQATEELERGR